MYFTQNISGSLYLVGEIQIEQSKDNKEKWDKDAPSSEYRIGLQLADKGQMSKPSNLVVFYGSVKEAKMQDSRLVK